MVSNFNLNLSRVTTVFWCRFEFLFGFLGIWVTIRIRRESWCLPYEGFSQNWPTGQIWSSRRDVHVWIYIYMSH